MISKTKCQQPNCSGTVRTGIRDYISFDLLDDEGDPIGTEIQSYASVYAHLCDTCGEMVDVGVEPRELDAGVASMRAAAEHAICILRDMINERSAPPALFTNLKTG